MQENFHGPPEHLCPIPCEWETRTRPLAPPAARQGSLRGSTRKVAWEDKAPGKRRPLEASPPKVGAAQEGLSEVRLAQVGTPKVRQAQVGALQIGAAQVRLAEQAPGQVCCAEPDPRQVGPG